MANGIEMGPSPGTDDIIARIMAEIEEVIGLIEKPLQRQPVPLPRPAGDETTAATRASDPN